MQFSIARFFDFVVLCSAIIVCVSCGSDRAKQEMLAPLSPTLSTDIIRFDHLVHQLPGEDLLPSYTSLTDRYPKFAALYRDELLQAKTPERLEEELRIDQNDSSFVLLYDDVQKIMGDLSDVKPEIDQMLENYLKVFDLPESQLPNVYTFVSGFSYLAFLFDDGGKDGLGVGLDMFLGDQFPYATVHPANPNFSQYLVRTYNKDHMARKIAEVLVEDQMLPPAKSDFLTLMIWGGKKLYLMDRLLDFKSDSIVIEYTGEQYAWCQENESQIWNHFFEEDLFYETNLTKFNKLIAPAPKSPGMPPEAPGQTGNYMGWQIIKAYMKRYPETSIRDLINLVDAQNLLDQSKYKPGR